MSLPETKNRKKKRKELCINTVISVSKLQVKRNNYTDHPNKLFPRAQENTSPHRHSEFPDRVLSPNRRWNVRQQAKYSVVCDRVHVVSVCENEFCWTSINRQQFCKLCVWGGRSHRKLYKKYTLAIVPRKSNNKKREKMFELHVDRPLPFFLADAWWTFSAKTVNVAVAKTPKQLVKCEPNHNDLLPSPTPKKRIKFHSWR